LCGIVGAVSRREVVPILLEGLRRLEYRGYDSAGISTVEEDSVLTQVREVGKVEELESRILPSHLNGKIGIAHTRWATHGQPSISNAHPHTSAEELSVVHNGIIENYDSLKKELKKRGYTFKSDTDTEVLPCGLFTSILAAGELVPGLTNVSD